ncbi:unnamed protein product [Heterobilharzia americana]|nr:unnamed protein product [Heterobilharzia americana]
MIKWDIFLFTWKFPCFMKTFHKTNSSSKILFSGLSRCYSNSSAVKMGGVYTCNNATANSNNSSSSIKKLSSTALFRASTSLSPSSKVKDHQETNLGLGLFPPKKKRIDKETANLNPSGFFNISGYGFAQYIDLKMLRSYLSKCDLYAFPTLPSELYSEVLLISQLSNRRHTENYNPVNVWDAFVFNNGVVVFWNMPEKDHQPFLKQFREFSQGFLDEHLFEREDLRYCLSDKSTRLVGEDIYLQTVSPEDFSQFTKLHQSENQQQQNLASAGCLELTPVIDNALLEKFAFSDALALSVKLSLLENGFDAAVVEIEPWIENMKTGRGARFRRSAVLKKTGELYTIKHLLNVSTNLIETPDFYWERPEVEKLFEKLKSVLNISSRIRVLNSRLDMCNELTLLLADHLRSIHSIRLEWMIIILILVEVVFEALNYYDKSKKHG